MPVPAVPQNSATWHGEENAQVSDSIESDQSQHGPGVGAMAEIFVSRCPRSAGSTTNTRWSLEQTLAWLTSPTPCVEYMHQCTHERDFFYSALTAMPSVLVDWLPTGCALVAVSCVGNRCVDERRQSLASSDCPAHVSKASRASMIAIRPDVSRHAIHSYYDHGRRMPAHDSCCDPRSQRDLRFMTLD